MNLVCLILLVVSAVLWFFLNEYDRFFGVYYPTCAVKRSRFPFIVIVSLLSGIVIEFCCGNVHMTSSFSDIRIGCRELLVMLPASFIVLGCMKLFSLHGSAAHALIGAVGAFAVSVGAGSFRWDFVFSILISVLMAFALAYALRLLQRLLLRRSDIHLISLSYYMRIAVIAGVALSALGLGLNWGGFLLGCSALLAGVGDLPALSVVLLAVAFLLPLTRLSGKSDPDEPSGMFADFSIYAVVSVGLSIALTLLFFSFRATTAMVGLVPVPLSVSILVMAAVSGTEFAQKSPLVDDEQHNRELLTFFLTPSASFFLTYMLLLVIDMDKQDYLDDFAVMAGAVVVLAALFFLDYMRRQRGQKEAMDRLVYVQQQQIYEHSRALNDMELKVVLSENQALHNAVEMKRQEVMNVALSIVEQRDYLESLNEIAEQIAKADEPHEKDRLISELRSSLRQRLSHDREVDSQYFYSQAESLHEDFNAKLAENFPDLTQQERRLAAMLRLGFSSKYIATLMNITPKSVEISRYRLRQKLGLSKGINLVNFIKSI